MDGHSSAHSGDVYHVTQATSDQEQLVELKRSGKNRIMIFVMARLFRWQKFSQHWLLKP